MEEYIEDRIEVYLETKINYLKEKEEKCGFDKSDFGELLSLEVINQSNQKKNKLVDKILEDDDFFNDLDELLDKYIERGVKND